MSRIIGIPKSLINQGEYTRYLDDIYEYGKLETHTIWDGRNSYNDKIPKIENTIVELNDKYPATSTETHEYGIKINELVVGDYDRAWEYLPDGQSDRRLTEDAGAQCFIVPDENRVVIAFNRYAFTETLTDSLSARDIAIRNGDVLLSVGDSPEIIACHEWGHLMSNHLDNAMIYQDETALNYWKWYQGLSKDEIRTGLSAYATTNRGEFEAECFAELQLPNPRPLALKFKEYLDEAITKGY